MKDAERNIRQAMFDQNGFRFCSFVTESDLPRLESLLGWRFVKWIS